MADGWIENSYLPALFGLGGGGGGGLAQGGQDNQSAGAAQQPPGLGGFGAQSMIGLGLGLMAGNPFNRYGPALQGYQAGAQADLARSQAAQLNAYRQQELALRQQQLERPPEQIRTLTELERRYGPEKARQLLFPRAEGQWTQIGSGFWGDPRYGFVNIDEKTVQPFDSRTNTLGPAQSFDQYNKTQELIGGAAVPYTTGGAASTVGAIAAPPAPGERDEPPSSTASAAEHEAYLRRHPELDPKAYRAGLTKGAVMKAMGREEAQRNASNTLSAIDNVAAIAQAHPYQTTGMFGKIMGNLAGSPAHDLQQALETVRANVAFGRLQEMRQASPTGGALGQVSNQEEKMLSASVAALAQSQSHAAFMKNLEKVRRQFYDVVNGPGAYDRANPTRGGMVAGPAQGTREWYRQKLKERGIDVPE